MRNENVGVLSVMSDVSESSDSDEELLHVLDPSDPRAHHVSPSVVQPTRTRTQKSSRWDSDDDDLGEPVTAENDTKKQKPQTPDIIVIDDDESTPMAQKSRNVGVTLSKWAQSRFLVPASKRKHAVLEENPLEPLNDFILSDFSSRYRGGAGNVIVEKEMTAEEKDEQIQSNKIEVGAPLFETNSDNMKKDQGEDDEKDSKRKKQEGHKRRENRYFITDLATKCFQCGEVGHMAYICMKDKLHPPCYNCAMRGHQSWECPNLPCTNCLQQGHQKRDCNNQTLRIKPCRTCGRTGHRDNDCDNVGSQEQVTCMVCMKVGHLHCVPIPPPADRRVYCPNCAENHVLERCRTYREPAATDFAYRAPSRRFYDDRACYVCHELDHLAADCPDLCNRCSTPGSLGACNCSKSRKRRQGRGRKRDRDVKDEHLDDEDENHFSYDGDRHSRSKGSSSRSRKSSGNQGYARLNEALPTRPHKNNTNHRERRHHSRR